MRFETVDTRTPFVGRYYEVRKLVALFETGGVLTLVGPGGVGKSRLAIEAALRCEPLVARRMYFVPLAGVTEGRALDAVLATLGIPDTVGTLPIDTLRDHLRRERSTLILDNCEHVAHEIRYLIDGLRGVDCAIVATSQRPLHYADEAIFRLEPFSDEDAARFLIARAHLNETSLGADAREAIAHIVTRLDRMAIAIDLAAARLKSLSLAELAESLTHLTPYQLRSTGVKDPRHRTIGNTIAWALGHLDDRARRVFALASLWSETFDATDVASLCDDADAPASVSDALEELAECSLVVRNGTRFAMLAPIRAVATRTLAEQPNRRAIDERFAVRMDALALAARERLESVDPGDTVTTVLARYNDYCAALSWALEAPLDRISLVMEIAPILCVVWADGGRYVEGTRWADRLVAIATLFTPALRGRIYWTGVRVAHAAYEFERMISIAQLAVTAFSIAGSQIGLARAYNALSTASMSLGRIDDAEAYIETALAIYTTLGHERGISAALTNAGNIALEGRKDPQSARDFYERALALLLKVGNDALTGITYGNLAEAEYAARRYDACERNARASMTYFERSRSTGMLGWQHQLLARVSIARHELASARKELQAALECLREAPQPGYVALTAEATVRLLSREGAFDAAALASRLARRLRAVRRIPCVGPAAEEVRADDALLARRLRAETLEGIASEAATADLATLPQTLERLLAFTMVKATGGEEPL